MPDPFSGLAFGALILPLAGFVVLALFGDAIKREEDQARAKGETGWLGTLKANGTW